MKRKTIIMAFCGLLLATGGCQPSGSDYKGKLRVKTEPVTDLEFHRYEDVLFNLDTANFQEELLAIQNDYKPFLEGDLSNPLAIKYLKDFATDTFSINLYHIVKEVYPDLRPVEEIVQTVYRHFNYYYPEIKLPNKIFTCVSGINPDNTAVMVLDDALVISLDWYLNHDAVYDRVGMPQYLSERTNIGRLPHDLGHQVYLHAIYQWRKQTNLLEEMVNMGKIDYFIEALYPDIIDTDLLGYTPQQLEWAEVNEGNIWADMVGNQRLFATGLEMYRIFLSDGPFTNEYSHEAPSRLGEFIGLHIVRSYMGNNEVSLQELMKDNDLQGIFQKSKYKPKK